MTRVMLPGRLILFNTSLLKRLFVPSTHQHQRDYVASTNKPVYENISVEYVREVNRGSRSKDRSMVDCLYPFHHGDYQYLWKFHNKASVDEFSVNIDNNKHVQGASNASFTLSKNKTGLFSGYVKAEYLQDKKKNLGYCNLSSRDYKGSNALYYEGFNCLVMRVRGDGRTYILNMKDYFVIENVHEHVYSHPLSTRGGPYWETIKIPLAKMYCLSQGRINNRQDHSLATVKNFGITVSGITGPFSLEIDSIAWLYDTTEPENETSMYVSEQ